MTDNAGEPNPGGVARGILQAVEEWLMSWNSIDDLFYALEVRRQEEP